jgi:hypothetical protein
MSQHTVAENAIHLRDMEHLRVEYEGGDKTALSGAICMCITRHRPLPDWAGEAFRGGWVKALSRQADWNDLLGAVRVKTPKQIARERRKLELAIQIKEILPSVMKPIARDGKDDRFTEAAATLSAKMGRVVKPREVRELVYATVTVGGEKFRLLPASALRRSRPTRPRR